ncbi:MAG TPA: methyltransferase, TIGR04325 family [Puia sp.]|nr:methyltransferase, TIGR04325 family [Puia sp.]
MLKKTGKYGWSGDYKSWQEAKQLTDSYDDSIILDKVKLALLKVRRGEAVYERDSVLFEKIQYSWPLLSALMWIAMKNNGALRVADFGGSLGSSYFQNRKFLDTVPELQWNIIEQKNFVTCGLEYFQDNHLHFFYTTDELIEKQGLPDLLLLSCVLPYLEKPYDILLSLMQYKIPYIFIDNTYFNYEPRDRICIQLVPPQIYKASYPCWMLNYDTVKKIFSDRYMLISEHENESSIFLDGKKIQYKGLFFKIKE